MGAATKISWTHKTWNPWWGCRHRSPGCRHCFAEAISHRFGRAKWGNGEKRSLSRDAYWAQLKQWDKAAFKEEHTLVFVGSMMDVFDDEVPIEWHARLLEAVHECNNLTFQFLTKLPHRWKEICNGVVEKGRGLARTIAREWLEGRPPCDLWMGASVEDQEWYDRRIGWLREIPAVYHFLSIEPLLGPILLDRRRKVDWIILGGESGDKARDCDLDQVGSLVVQADEQLIRCFVKQLGAAPLQSVGDSKIPLKLLDPSGSNPAEWPAWLRVQEFPFEEDYEDGRKILGGGPEGDS